MSMNVKEYYISRLKISKDKLEEGDLEAYARHVSRQLMKGEAAVQVGAMFFCERAGDDRRGKDAQAQSEVEQALDMIKAAHRILSRVGAQQDLLDIPGEGGRG